MRTERPSLGSVGSGRLAATLLPLWANAGWSVSWVAGRNATTVGALARRVHAKRALDLKQLNDRPGVVLLAVPDDAITGVAETLAAQGSWSGRTVLHHAGAYGPELLEPLARCGAATGVLHPLQVMPRNPRKPLPAATRARCEGVASAVRIARRLARDAGLVPLPSRLEWTPTTRTEYHIAATLAANDLAALVVAAARLLESNGIGSEAALKALLPLARGALDQLETERPGDAVSGPIPRGDVETLSAHLEQLDRLDPALQQTHRLLSLRVLELAAEANRLPDLAQKQLSRLLRGGRNPKPEV